VPEQATAPLTDEQLENQQSYDEFQKKQGENVDRHQTLFCGFLFPYILPQKPILPEHDSFIVQAQYEDLLRRTMAQEYKKTNKGFTCPIRKV
jgi:hypothetical protein